MDEAAIIRRAGREEAATVAALHAASWRSAYRGIYPDAYLDGPVWAERRAFWRAALSDWDGERDAVFLAEAEGGPVGFACLRRDSDPAGPLLDNLHVLPERQGQGIGRRLIGRAAAWLAEREPGAGLQLLVWEANAAARAFYARLGGVEVETIAGALPDGGTAPEVRVRWPRAAALAESGAAPAANRQPESAQ
jgi:GNAT superfamily N-acetyltransferase